MPSFSSGESQVIVSGLGGLANSVGGSAGALAGPEIGIASPPAAASRSPASAPSRGVPVEDSSPPEQLAAMSATAMAARIARANVETEVVARLRRMVRIVDRARVKFRAAPILIAA